MEARNPISPPEAASTFDESQWAARLVGAGSALTLLFELVYLFFDRRFISIDDPRVLIFHSINIVLFMIAALMTLRVGRWMRRHWKPTALGFSSAMIASTTAICVITGATEPLFVTLMLFLSGTGPFLSWGVRYQAVLSVAAFGAFGIATAKVPQHSPDAYYWLGISVAAAVGLFSTALLRGVRRARRKAEERLQESRAILVAQERLRITGQLASGIAHDLNNTLNVMKLRLAALLQDDALTPQYHERLRGIARAIDDSARIVSRVRELGRVHADHPTDTTQLYDAILQAIDFTRQGIEGRTLRGDGAIDIGLESAPPLPKVRGETSDIRSVFLNLFLNASDAMPRGGKIRILTAPQGGLVVVQVSDEGSGIPKEHAERIFEPFFTTKGTGGTGLGLSLAREIMSRLGGSISAQNRPTGGAVFTLKFPIAPDAPPQGEPASDERQSSGCRFLLVDDDVANLDALREVLELHGHTAEVASCGVAALRKLEISPSYDAVLCDLTMPEMNGLEVARRALEIAPDVNFYIATGWGAQFENEALDDPSILGVISKPINIAEIERIVSKIRQRRARSHLTA